MDHPQYSEKRYFLASHAYVCSAGDQLLFLDLRCNKYLRVAISSSGALERWVSGWPATGAWQEKTKVLQDLLERGILTTDVGLGKDAAFARVPEPAKALADLELSSAVRINLRYAYAFLKAVAIAKFGLAFKNLTPIVARVRHRKDIAQKLGTTFDLAYLRGLLEVFDTLRPFAFGTHNVCLLHSVALLEFLAQYKIFPTWIVGVQPTPFSAHSWIQYEDYALSDMPTGVEMFTPILVV